MLKLGVNIDHVATLRQARGTDYPDMTAAARSCEAAGAEGITIHLREDRRHIQDADVYTLRERLQVPMNLEMANSPEIVGIALDVKPHEVCLVPEKREELTTEGGLDVAGQLDELRPTIESLAAEGVSVSLFIDPDPAQIEASASLGVPYVELHTGTYCDLTGEARLAELEKIRAAVELADRMGIECHAGHGLTFNSVKLIAGIPNIRELNIGHFLIAEAIFTGLPDAIKEMKKLIREARLTVY